MQTPYQQSEIYQKWFTKEAHPLGTLKGHTNSIESVAFNPTNPSEVVTGSHDKTIKRWDLNSFKCVDTFLEHKFNFLLIFLIHLFSSILFIFSLKFFFEFLLLNFHL